MQNDSFWIRHKKAVIFWGILFLIFLSLLIVIPTKQFKTTPKVTPTAAPQWQTYDQQVKQGKIAPAKKVLEVTLNYNEKANPQLTVTHLTRKNGYPPKALPQDNDYELQLLDANQKVLSQEAFTIPKVQRTETFDTDSSIKNDEKILSHATFITTLTWQSTGVQLRVTDKKGITVLTAPVTAVQDIDNKPAFKTIQGDELLKQPTTQEEKHEINVLKPLPAFAQAKDGKVDVVFVSNGYTSNADFQSEINRISTGLLKYEPLKTRASQFAFRAVYNQDNLGCTVDPATSILTCDPTLVRARVSKAAVPEDIIIVLYNDTNPALRGTGGNIVSLHRSARAPNSVAHEFGHTIGRLLDEYIPSTTNGAIDNKPHYLGTTNADPEPAGDGNCLAGNPPASAWKGLNPPVATSDYKLGCDHPNWYSPSLESVMNTTGDFVSCFDTVSQGIVGRRLDALVGAFPGGSVPIVPCHPVLPTAAPPAPTGVVPTFQCIGTSPCTPTATLAPGTSLAPSGGSTGVSGGPSIIPSGTGQPCTTTSTFSTVSNEQAVAENSHGGHHHHQGGFLSSLFQFLFILIFLLLQQSGGLTGLPCPTTTVPSPSVQVQTSIAPVTSTAPTVVAPITGTTGRTYPWHANIVSTTFWVGELFNANLADGSQVCSTYDSNWAFHWSGVNKGTVSANAAGCAGAIIGGCDGVPGANNACATEKRTAANGYFPTKITPKENPFYLDLPFDDLNDTTAFGQRCTVIPWANDPGYTGHCTDKNFSYMKNKFVRIVGPNGNTCYGQIEDAGPSEGNLYHDASYVFGTNDARPVQKQFNNAGADVSPALNGCLGFAELDGQNDHIKWQFVDDGDVPAGPWKKTITKSGVTL